MSASYLYEHIFAVTAENLPSISYLLLTVLAVSSQSGSISSEVICSIGIFELKSRDAKTPFHPPCITTRLGLSGAYFDRFSINHILERTWPFQKLSRVLYLSLEFLIASIQSRTSSISTFISYLGYLRIC